MKKIYLLLLAFFALVTGTIAQNSNGIFESYAILSINGGANAYYDMQAATANPDFQGAYLGGFNSTQTLVVKGGQNKTFKCGSGDVFNGRFRWRVWLTSAGASGTFNIETMSFVSNDGVAGCGTGQNQTWEGTTGATNIISGLTTPGNYTLEVYSEADGTPTATAFSNNGGANYKATFNFCGPAAGALPAGNYAIPGCFATVAAAVTYINTNGVTGTGAVQFDVAAGYTETVTTLGGISITATGTATNPIIFKKAGAGANPTITAYLNPTAGLRNDGVIKIIGGDYITIDGFTLQENSGNTTGGALAAQRMTEYGVGIFLASATNGAQNNTIQNCTIIMGTGGAYQNAFGIFSSSSSSESNGALAATATTGTNSNNKFYNNTISGVAYGLYFICEPITTTITESGIDIGGTSAATANTITFGNATSSDIGYTRFSATNPAAIGFRNGAGDNVQFNNITSNSLAYAQSNGVFGVNMVAGGTAPVGVTYTSTISNNTITLTNTGATAITGVDFGGGIATGTIAGSVNTINITHTLGVANTAAVIGVKANYTSATNTCNSNTITINQNVSAGANSGTTTGLTLAGTTTTINVVSNGITINQTGSGTGTITGSITLLSGAGTSTTNNIQTNTLTVNQTTSVVFGITNAITGIVATSAATTLNITTNNTVTIKQGVTGAGTYGAGAIAFASINAAHGNVNITNNTFNTTASTIRSTGGMDVLLGGATTLTGLLTIKNNIANIDRVAASGAVGFYTQTSTSPNDLADSISSNTISFNNLSGTSTATVINRLGGSTSATKNYCNNVISVSGTNTGTVTGILYAYSSTVNVRGNSITISTVSPTIIGISGNSNSGAAGISNNTLNLSSSTTSPTALTGISVAGSGAHSITANVFTALNYTGVITTGGTTSAIAVSVGTGANVFSNTVNNISVGAAGSTGSPVVDGILVSGGTSINVFKNKIHGITTAANGATTSISGIRMSGGTTNSVYNNFISYLSAPSATNGASVNGINITAASGTENIYFNTIALGTAGALTGGTNFGASGIIYPGGTTNNIKNNIVWLDATPSGTGTVVAIRKSAAGTAGTPPTIASFSTNNNIYNVQSPGVNKYLYAEGIAAGAMKNGYGISIGIADDPVNNLKNDAGFNTSCGLYKLFMNANGEGGTFNENNLTEIGVSKTFSPTGSSYAETGGISIGVPSITDDYNGIARAANPDMGALEFAGSVLDAAAPSITYTALPASTVCINPPTLSVTITDPSLINVLSGTKPRLWYRKSGAVANANALPADNTNATDGWKWVEATNAVSPFTFTFDYTIVNGGVAVGDAITYFIVAQDNVGTPNVGSKTVTYAPGYCPASVALAAGAFPATGALNSFTIAALPATNATATPITVCRTGTSSLNLSVPVTGVTYQWQSSPAGLGTFTDIAGATTVPYTATVTASTDYRCNFYCGVTLIGSTATNATVTVTGPAITFAALPYTQDFETWTNGCSITDIPTSDWVGSPVTGNNSWRRDDLGADAAWANVASYIYSPVFSTGAHSARFHAGQASSGSVGTLDLNVNMSTSGGNAVLSFDHINTSGTDSLVIQYSIDGGATFVRLDSLRSGRAIWANKSINLTGIISATTIIRFRAIADFGSTDIGLDNVQVLVPCSGSPTPGSITGSASLCAGNSGTTLSSTGATSGVGITHHWAYSTTPGGPYTALGTALTQATGALAVTTYFIDTVRCTASGLFTVTPEFTITVNPLPATTTVTGAGTFCNSTTINAANGADGTMYFQGTTSGGTSTATPATSAVITASGTYYFRAQSAAGCWGIEGSAAVVIQTSAVITTTPAIVCLGGSGTIAASSANSCAGFANAGTALSGTFTATDPQALRPTTSIVNTSTCSFDATILRGYQAQQFQVNTSGTYTFDMTSTDDGMAYITSGAFVPGSCGAGTWIKGDDDSGPGNDPQLSMPLTAGITYTLYSTTYSLTSGASTAAYSWAITPPSGGQIMLPAAGNIEWYTTAGGGTAIGTGSPFNPVGVGGSPLANTNTAGTTVFYAACSNSPVCRTPVNFIITSAATNAVLATTSTNGVNLPAGCDEGTWTYYKDPTDATKYLFGIEWGALNASAKAAAIPKLQLDAANGSAEDIPGVLATYTMKRYWDVDLNGSTLNAPVNVRFFYSAGEKSSIITQRDAFILANGGVPRPFQWFKTVSGSTFVPATNVTPSTVTNSFNLPDVTNGTGSLNGIPYAQFDGLTGFSGGTGTTGVGGSPLPVKVEYFRGTKQGSNHLLDWKVTCTNTQYATLTLELSADGRNFSSIYSTRETALRCQQPFSYTNIHPLNGINYYRLKMTDDNGVITYSSIVALTNAGKGLEFINITPNPVATDGRFKLNIASADQVKMEIIITDVAGRVMVKQASTLIAGFNAIDMNVSNLANGVYQVYGNTTDGKTRVLQFVKQ